MDPLQQKAIITSMDYICPNTTAVDEIVINLFSLERIGVSDIEIIQGQPTSHKKCQELYLRIRKQKGAWEDLLNILKKHLNSHIASHLKIQLDKLRKEAEQPKNEKVLDAGTILNDEDANKMMSPFSIQAEQEEPGPGPSADHNVTTKRDEVTSESEPKNKMKAYLLEDEGVGIVIVINNEFKGSELERKGSTKDVTDIQAMFKGHRVILWLNMTKDDLEEELNMIQTRVKNKKYSFCILIYMSHGKADNILCTNDNQEIHVYNDLIYKFDHKSVPELQGKPKIFFIQACCGNCLEDRDGLLFGKPIRTRSEMEDTFIGFACRPSRQSLRNLEHGAIYIQAILQVFQRNWQHEDLEALHKMVVELVKTNREQTPECKNWDFKSFKFPFLFQGSP